jgi:predicted nucleotidyltransferase
VREQLVTEKPLIKTMAQLAATDSNIAVLWLYGSQAKGSAQSNSDFDLAVAFKSFPTDAQEERLQPELLAQSWADILGLEDKFISVVDINHIPIQLAMSIIEFGRPIQVNESMRLITEENRISSMWELDHQYHREHYG